MSDFTPAWKPAVTAAGGIPGYFPDLPQMLPEHRNRCAALYRARSGDVEVLDGYRFEPITRDKYGARAAASAEYEYWDRWPERTLGHTLGRLLGEPQWLRDKGQQLAEDSADPSAPWNNLTDSLGATAKAFAVVAPLVIILVAWAFLMNLGILPPVGSLLKRGK